MAKGGKDFLLQRSNGDEPETFDTIAGLRSTGFSGDAEAIDVSSQDSEQNKEILDEAGMKSWKISGSGVAKSDAVLDSIEEDFDANKIRRYRVKDMSPGGKTRTGSFKITSFEITGEYKGEQQWSITLESSGAIERT